MRSVATVLLLLTIASDAFQLNPAPGSKRYTWLRESEKKHGRIALLAIPALASIALTTGENPLPFLNAQSAPAQVAFYSLVGALESVNLERLDEGFTLKDNAIPGRVLPVSNATIARFEGLEDAAGRIAMLAVVGGSLAIFGT
jgi:hypothetical protein